MKRDYLDSEIASVGAGEHILGLYESDEERWDIVIPYILQGIEQGEQVIYFSPADIAQTAGVKIIENSEKAKSYLDKNLIKFITDDRIFTREGTFNPFDVIAFFYAETQRALSEGFRALRIVQEMAWGGKMVAEGTLLIQHDIALNDFIKTTECSLLCLYDKRKFEQRVLVNILKGHPRIFTKNRLMKNFYYIPPRNEMALQVVPIDLDYMLDSMIRQHDYEEMGRTTADQLSAVFKNIPIAMFIVDKDRKIKMINERGIKILNSDTVEILDEKFGNVISCINSFDDENGCGFGINCEECEIRKSVASTFETGIKHTNVEAPVTKLVKGEPTTSYYLVSTCLLDEKEKTVLVSLLDITEKKKAEEKLKREVDKSEKLLSIVADMIVVLDRNGNVKKVNRRACEILGYKEEEILGKNWFDNFLPERDKEELRAVFSTIKIGDIKTYARYQNPIITKAGDERLIEWTNSIILDEKGEIEGIISSGRDITDQMNMLEALKASEEKYRLISENVSDVIWTVDLNLGFTYISPSAEKLLGYSLDEIRKMNFSDILTPSSYKEMLKIYQERQALREKGEADATKTLTIELEARRKDEKTIWTETNLSYLTDREGKICGMLGVTRDISQKNNMILMDRLIQVGQLVAGVAHEINNPAGYISTNSVSMNQTIKDIKNISDDLAKLANNVEDEQLKNRFFTLLSKQLTLIEEMNETVQENLAGLDRIKKITTQLRNFSRADSEDVGLVNINEAIDSAVTMVYNQISQFAKFSKNLHEPMPTIEGKAGRLSQVFVNLLTNAVHAVAQKGGRKEENYIRINSCVEGDKIVVSVEDSGIGIPEEIYDKIFEQFFTTKERGMGTGLGLALCRKVVMEHNGEISFTSKVNSGTVFKVSLPVNTGLRISEKLQEKTKREFLLPSAKILIIDDEKGMLNSLRRLLGKKHQVVLAESGTEALGFLTASDDFDVIICDLLMPDIDGEMLYETICESYPHLQNKIIFTTGGTFTPKLSHFFNEIKQSHICLNKPVEPNELNDAINSIIRKKSN